MTEQSLQMAVIWIFTWYFEMVLMLGIYLSNQLLTSYQRKKFYIGDL